MMLKDPGSEEHWAGLTFDGATPLLLCQCLTFCTSWEKIWYSIRFCVLNFPYNCTSRSWSNSSDTDLLPFHMRWLAQSIGLKQQINLTYLPMIYICIVWLFDLFIFPYHSYLDYLTSKTKQTSIKDINIIRQYLKEWNYYM